MYLLPSERAGVRSLLPRRGSWGLALGAGLSVLGVQLRLPDGIGQRLAAACILVWLCLLGWRFARRS
jgi:hypothetical protein